jgi:tetratricopeptide (TPR) repeat protein
VNKLQLTLSSLEEKQIQKKEINEEAYTLFLKGLYKYKADQFEECIAYELKAIHLDTTYAPAYAYIGLSKVWINFRYRNNQDSVLVNEALQYSERAIALDPKFADSYSSIGLISWRAKRDFAKARTYFEKSIELNPSSSLNKNRYSYFLTWMGDFTKAAQLAHEAIQLDPADFNGYINLFNSAILSGNIDDAAKHLRDYKLLFGLNRLGLNSQINLNFRQGSFLRVIQQMDSLLATGTTPEVSHLSLLSRSYFKLNRKSESEMILKKLKKMASDSIPNASYESALVYALRNEPDSCFYYLTMAAKRNDPNFVFLKIDLTMQALRSDPRYKALYHQGGFDKYP